MLSKAWGFFRSFDHKISDLFAPIFRRPEKDELSVAALHIKNRFSPTLGSRTALSLDRV